MERGHGKLDIRPLAGGSRSLEGGRVVRHCAGILAAVRRGQDPGRPAIDARGRQAYDPPRSHFRLAIESLARASDTRPGAAALIPRHWRLRDREWRGDPTRPTLRPRERALLHRGV